MHRCNALDFGVPVTHLDTHMGAVASRPDWLEVYVKLGVEFGVPVFFCATRARFPMNAFPCPRAGIGQCFDKHKRLARSHDAALYQREL